MRTKNGNPIEKVKNRSIDLLRWCNRQQVGEDEKEDEEGHGNQQTEASEENWRKFSPV